MINTLFTRATNYYRDGKK